MGSIITNLPLRWHRRHHRVVVHSHFYIPSPSSHPTAVQAHRRMPNPRQVSRGCMCGCRRAWLEACVGLCIHMWIHGQTDGASEQVRECLLWRPLPIWATGISCWLSSELATGPIKFKCKEVYGQRKVLLSLLHPDSHHLEG